MLTFLHGFLGVVEDWEEITRRLSCPYRCLSLPGHRGRSLDLQAFEEEIGSGVTLVGYSMGGRLAMHYALKYPKRVNKLILLSANPGEEGAARLASDEKWACLLEKEGMERFLDAWYAQPLFKGFQVDRTQRRHDPLMLAQVIRTFSPARLPNLWPKLKDFACPLAFLFGENDIKYRLIGKKLQEQFPVTWIPNSGHAIHIENPKQCAKHLMEAL
ncbi:MAG: alpha/beta fold hydrolase [Chlamydiia bacterium]|nr:alpha/beta fold hydrolase [Chlamydiia bacterium]